MITDIGAGELTFWATIFDGVVASMKFAHDGRNNNHKNPFTDH